MNSVHDVYGIRGKGLNEHRRSNYVDINGNMPFMHIWDICAGVS